LYYIHDPMCSWCWGFNSTWQRIQEKLALEINIETVLGGLAPDSNGLMTQELQENIKANWQRIQQVIPSVDFNYAFWSSCQPRRSTYPACRAVLSAKAQNKEYGGKMISAIQKAYYLDAKNPSDDEVLISLADDLDLQTEKFKQDLNSKVIQQQLDNDIDFYHELSVKSGASGFPSVVLNVKDRFYAVPRDYVNSQTTLDFIDTLI
jgi:putative protein-disulfide isomerase